MIIFTAFSDTAEYIYDTLAENIKTKHGLNTVLITGSVDARSTLKLKGSKGLSFNQALTLFSPRSKDKETLYPDIHEGIDVLIATDCISEDKTCRTVTISSTMIFIGTQCVLFSVSDVSTVSAQRTHTSSW